MTTQKDWADSSNSEDEIDYVNIAPMAISSKKNGSPKSSTASSNQISIFSAESFNILDSEDEIRNLLAHFRSLTNETDRVKNTNA